jgi:CxxC motif-containing protein (DUF1111 family)
MKRRSVGLAFVAVLATPAVGAADGLTVAVGKALFDRDWVAAPASTRATDGLGPLHNARSCAACHPGGGRARTVDGAGLVIRFPGVGAYGAQLQTAAVHGQAAEGELVVRFEEEVRTLDDGLEVRLRRPHFSIDGPAFGPVPQRLSPRLAPSLRGVGRLDQVPEAVLAAGADPADRDGDGIRGRQGAGRFGLRGERPDLDDQIAEALLRDLGLASSARPFPAGDCTPAEVACRDAIHGDRDGTAGIEVAQPILAAIGAFVGALRPGPIGDAEPPGLRVFEQIGCTACHVRHLPVVASDGRPGQIAPFTDLLLHDLGPALADQGSAADEVDARLWRTAPLWNLGRDLAAGAPLLHDGRARDALEAVLWHGGEAAATRARFRALPADDRADLLAFLGEL